MRPGRPPPCAPHHPPPPAARMARPPHSGCSPGTRKIRQKRHGVQVPAVPQPHPREHGGPCHPRGAHPQGWHHQRPRRRPPGSRRQLPGTTRGRPPLAGAPHQKHHPRACAQGLQPGRAARHGTRPLQHLRTATRPGPPEKVGRAQRRRFTGRSVPTPHPARQAPPGSPPVGHRHGHHAHPPLVGQPGPPPLQEG